MGSLPEERHKQAREVYRHWLKLCKLYNSGKKDYKQYRLNERSIIERLEELCAPEIRGVVFEAPVRAVLCDTHLLVGDGKEVVSGAGSDVVHKSVGRALKSMKEANRPVHEHLRSCVAETLEEEASRQVAYLNGLKASDLLAVLSSVALWLAALLIDHLNQNQQKALRDLLYRELGDKPRMVVDRELKLPTRPTLKQRYAWLHWYAWRLYMHSPEFPSISGGVPQVVVVGNGDRMLMNRKTGMPADPLGPIHAKVWLALCRELNKHGHPIKDPESINRIAKSAGVSRATLRRYLDADVHVEINPDGKGGVDFKYTMDDLLAALQASSRKKRNSAD